MMAEVVSEHSRGPALKRRKADHWLSPPTAQALCQDGERIGLWRRRRFIGDMRMPAARPDPFERIPGQVRISADLSVRQRAIQKEKMRQARQVLKRLGGIGDAG